MGKTVTTKEVSAAYSWRKTSSAKLAHQQNTTPCSTGPPTSHPITKGEAPQAAAEDKAGEGAEAEEGTKIEGGGAPGLQPGLEAQGEEANSRDKQGNKGSPTVKRPIC